MQRYFVLEKKEDYLALENSDLHHIKNVMRFQIGTKIECVFEKKLYICEIENLSSRWVHILSSVDTKSSSTSKVAVAVALVKEQKMDLILQKLTELAVDEIIPVKMERSIVKLEQEKLNKRMERWQKICKEAAEQSKRIDIPKISSPLRLSELSKLSYDKKFVCSTKNSQKINYKFLQPLNDYSKIFVIGPEGGITDEEEKFLLSSDYSPVSLGNQIMRVETAAIYVASVLNFMK